MDLCEGYRMVTDMETLKEGDLAFGTLDNGKTGWGRIPPSLVGQIYCEGWVGHPPLIMRKKEEEDGQDSDKQTR
jgi:hypothetical protein